VTLVPGIARREPVALLVGAGLAIALAYAAVVAIVRLVTLRRLSVTLPASILESDPGAAVALHLRPGGVRSLPAGAFSLRLASGVRSGELVGNVGPRRVPMSATVAAPALSRGLYRIGELRFDAADLLGLVVVSCRGSAPVSLPPCVRVLPALVDPTNTAVPQGFGTGIREADLSRDRSDELIEARPYHPGDDTRRINWKTYAHSGALFVRIGEEIPPPSKAAALVVDAADAETAERVDRLVAAALSIAARLRDDGHVVAVSVVVPGGGRTDAGDPDRARRVCAALDPRYGLLPGHAEGLAPPQRVDTGGHELVVAWDGDALAVWYRDPTGGVHDAGTIAL